MKSGQIKKKLWIMGMLVAVLLSGCAVKEHQIKHAGGLLEKVLPGGEDKEDIEQEQENSETSDESLQEMTEELSEEDKSISENENASSKNESSSESEIKGGPPIILGSESKTEESTQSQTEEISYKTKYVVNCKKSITLREYPSTSAAQLEEILLGEPVSFIKDDVDGFSKIVYQGKTGYVLAAYLGDSAPTVNDTAYYTMRVVNCRESISLRRSPSVSASEICQIPLGAIVSYVDSAADGFYEVNYLGKNGYALASYLEFYSAPESGTSPAAANSTEAVRVSFEYFVQNGRECANVVGLNKQNQKVWQYDARSTHEATELESIQEIGIIGDAYYLNEDGTIVALALGNGQVLWKNADFGGASVSFDTDEQGTLYICGYYGPDLCAIDRNGNTLIYIASFSPDLQWPYEVKYENHVVNVTCTGSNMDQDIVVKYDLATGGISY